MTAFTLLAAGAWPGLVLLALAIGLGAWCSRRAAQRTAAALGPRATALVGRPAWPRLRAACALLAAAAAGIAGLQPAWGVAAGGAPVADVVLCLDLSRSMAARDVAPTRLGAAQQAIERLAAAAPALRLGLVVFAGSARLAVPLTGDTAAVATLVATLAPGDAGGGGSAGGAAIEVAAAALARAGAAGGCIVVLGDGEDFGAGAAAAAARARAQGAVVFGLGFGSEAGSKIVVPLASGEVFLRDAAGRDVVTRLDLAGLAAVARAGGGHAERATGADALLALHDAALAERATAQALAAGRAAPAPRFGWFLCAACLFWMLRMCLPERRR
ncbi:MAG: VWA domain-containing protein [Planctomycetes bacterium]|nr:VWA domain-containing protein [Planctomycetota bacterium]